MKKKEGDFGMIKKKIVLIYLIAALIVSVSCGTSELQSLREENISRVEAFDTSQFKGKDLKVVNEYIADAKENISEADSAAEIEEIVSELEAHMDEVRTGKASSGGPDSAGCID